MKKELCVHHYYSAVVGWLELQVAGDGVRSVSFVSAPAEPQVCNDRPLMDRLIKELDAYFAGKLKVFTVPPDPDSGTDFQRRVWKQLEAIPYGETRSYAQIAAAIGDPKAARAVGSANGCNPIPIVVPCHRVIKTDGTLGGYSSGVHIKKKLLDLEGISI